MCDGGGGRLGSSICPAERFAAAAFGSNGAIAVAATGGGFGGGSWCLTRRVRSGGVNGPRRVFGRRRERTLLRKGRQQLETQRVAGGGGEPGMGQADAAQRGQQHVGERGEPQPELVGPHRRGAGAIRIEVELALFDPVLHLAAGA